VKIPPSIVAALCCALSAVALAAATQAPPASPPGGTAKAPKIDLNSASLDALRALEGITEERARAIVENRVDGCYESATELVDRKILPKIAYEKIKDKVTTSPCVRSDPPAAAAPGKRGK
jgi:DNA uptake protein ComE-like DNA-binding protein